LVPAEARRSKTLSKPQADVLQFRFDFVKYTYKIDIYLCLGSPAACLDARQAWKLLF
jgi:hypothetical protein